MKEEASEKKDDSTEKTKKKEKKEKKPKEPKPPKGPNCIDLISKDLDLGNRDSNNVNVEIDVSIIFSTRTLNVFFYFPVKKIDSVYCTTC